MRHALTFITASFFAYSAPIFAADSAGNYAVWGIGQASCHQFTTAYAQHTQRDYKHYLAGYLTAFNTLADGVYQATGKNTTVDNLARLNEHCTENPLHSFERAVQSLLLKEKAIEKAAPKEKTATWGRPPAKDPAP